ncbi:MAG: hypothetical protein U1E05_26520 [Patescibacteria group bacterium]|nr:hypothetical protein [Patescibacteria group bacterium]
MWFFCFMTLCVAVALAGVVWHQLFWWSMAGCGVLWLVGSLIEVLWLYRPSK